MSPSRYSLIIADRTNGRTRRLTVHVRRTVGLLSLCAFVPVAWLFSNHLDSQTEIEKLVVKNVQLELENANYRIVVGDLVNEISSLDAAVEGLSFRTRHAEFSDSRVEGMPRVLNISSARTRDVGTIVPSKSLDVLGDLLRILGQRLEFVRHGIARREAFIDATPSFWPADGWLSAAYGYRLDPFTGEREFHPAIDISTHDGQAVFATARGRVVSASRSGNYGNLVELDHGFGVTTRYGHLSRFAVAPGETVQRGDLIAYAGSTGRATGSHLHYEVWSSGQTINPLRLLPNRQSIAAN